MKCGNCGENMEKVKYDVGFGIVLDSYTCPNCHHNFTDEKILDEAIEKMRERMAIKVKILRVGTGIGIRLPNEIVQKMKLKAGQEVEVIQKDKQLIVK
jgi:transposase-like protein